MQRLRRSVMALAGVLALNGLFHLQALDPRTSLNQYLHTNWGTEQGFVWGPVYAFAQTDDGYLWIGTEKGLVRFDGSTFQVFNHENSPSFTVNAVLGLATDAEGSLWIRLRSPVLLRYRGGNFDVPSPNQVLPEEASTAMLRTARGDLLVAHSNRILKYANGGFSTAAANDRENLLVISMAESPDRTLWLGTRDSGVFSVTGNGISNITSGLPDRKVNSIVVTANRQVWIGTDSGVVRWTGSQFTRAGIPRCLQKVQALTMLQDRDSNVWIADPDGLIRVTPDGVCSANERKSLTDDRVSALFEDRDGNVWVGNAEGIERFRETLFTSYKRLHEQHLTNEGPIYVDAESRIWLAPTEGGLYWLSGAQVHEMKVDSLGKDVIYSITGGGHELWVGRQRGGLTRLEFAGKSFRAKTFSERSGMVQTSVSVVQRSRDGTVWVGSLNDGVSRFNGKNFIKYSKSSGLSSSFIKAIEEAPEGTLWFAGPNGLTMFSNDHWRNFTSGDGLPPGNINCLYGDPAGFLWIGTGRGLAYIKDRVVSVPVAVAQTLTGRITGITGDRYGGLWIVTTNKVLRVKRDALLRGRVGYSDIREFGANDGLLTLTGAKAVTSDGEGRIWFSTQEGVSVVDPARLNKTFASGAGRVVSVSAGGKTVAFHQAFKIPVDSQRVVFVFAGLSLSSPERVRFRYRLDGFDNQWSDPTASHEAVYTNLAPAAYRFRLIASNADGDWNSAESLVDFTVEPAIWQTVWFRSLTFVTLAVLAIAAYRYRLRQLTRQLNLRFEDRLAERVRIAQELHDTLLQGVMSASMLLHVAADELPPESASRMKLSRILALMSDVTNEGRRALRGLRTNAEPSSLDKAFRRIQEELYREENIEFRVTEEGRPRMLRPVIYDEVFRIGREALVNAYRHSGPRSIEVEMEYGAKSFLLFVRDDGCGISPEVMRSGLDDHWGLIGMRERAEKIGAQLSIWSRKSGGTEIRLCIPNQIAFESHQSTNLWWRRTRASSTRPIAKVSTQEETKSL